MRRMRTGILFAVAVTLALVSGNDLAAQIGPTLTGESGLFELRNADSLPAGRFSFAIYYNHVARTAAPSLVDFPGADNPLRYSKGKIGFSAAFGALDNVELVMSTGHARYRADDRDWNGVINGHERSGEISHNEWDKIRFGFKWVLNPKSAEKVKFAILGGVHIPTQKRSDPNALTSYRADWDIGLTGTYKIFTAGVSYTQRGDYRTPNATIATPDPGAEVPEELLIGIGFNVPIIKDTLHGIFEINRLYYDRSEASPDDFSEALLGARVWFGRSGVSAGAALRVNIDRWVHYGSSPSNIGGLVQVAWSPWVEEATVAKVAIAEPPPEPAPAPAAAMPEPQPAPLVPPAPAPLTEPAPPPRAPTSRTDEVLFDAGKARLTNIAKAILDDVALRLKNNLSATCTIVGHADPKEKGGDHMQLARARAEAAKDYLVKRHGIDASRIRTEARGDAEAGTDSTRNRRAVVTVTFP